TGLCDRFLDRERVLSERDNKGLPHGAVEPAATRAAGSSQPRQVFRSDTHWGRSVIEWASLDAFLAAAEVQSGAHSVPIGEFDGRQINYDFLLTARPGTVLLCHFHGNAPREGTHLPFFTGLGVTNSIASSRFIPSDPVLAIDASLSLAWHFGCEGIRLQAITVSIVKKLQTILFAPRVVAWGSSGGGFAAIRVAKEIQNSIALPWNPQTDIMKYVRDPVNSYLRAAFPNIASDCSLPSGRGQFPSLCTDEFADGYQGRILYLQERTDWHVRAHLKPFLASFCEKAGSNITGSSNFSGFVTDQLYLHLDHWGDGHASPSKDVISKVLLLLSDVTTNIRNRENLTGIPSDVIKFILSNLSEQVPATKVGEIIGSDLFGNSSSNDSP
ncbi:MAG: hypothetical protein ACREJN_17595, partial [Nitrospiraceae bacterium]